MLNDVFAVLSDIGLLSGGAARAHANIAWAHHMNVEVEAQNRTRYFVKAGPLADAALAREAWALGAAPGCLPGHTPALLANVTRNGLRFLVMSALDVEPVRALGDIVDDPQRLEQWGDVFRGLPQMGPAVPGAREEMRQFIDANLPALARHLGSKETRRQLEALPRAAQHGDLVANNIGHVGARPVVFDWEDFGKVDLPGFDIALLLGSLLSHDPEKIVALFSEEGRGAPWLVPLLAATGLERVQFAGLMPVYYGAFFWIKCVGGYGATIQSTVRHTIEQLVRDRGPG